MEELPIPLSRVELYLAKAAGMDVTPPEPKSRLELFLAKIAGMDVEMPTPLSLTEMWLAQVAGSAPIEPLAIEGAFYIDNQKVDVRYLAVASGVIGATLPAKPQNRKEQYWAVIASGGPIVGVLKYVTGTNITLTDVVRGIEELQFVYGDTYQQTYSGKNLMPYPYANGDSKTVRGITYTVNADGTVILNGQNDGTASAAYFFIDRYGSMPLFELSAGTYYFIPNTDGIEYEAYDGTNYYGFNANNNFSVTFPTNVSIRQLYVLVRRSNQTQFNNYKIYPMLTTSASPTVADYEPYTGGPSPNPDYPQDVQTVTGEQNVWVHGKNVIDNDDLTYDVTNVNASYIHLSTLPTGIRYMTTYHSTTGSPSIIFKTNIDLTSLAGKTIRLKVNFGAKGEASIYRLNDDNTVATNVGNVPASGETVSWTVPNDVSDAKWLGYRFRITQPGNEDYTVDFTDLIMTIDEADMTYEPYQSQTYPISLGSTELCKIGNYQDKIFNNDPNEDWYNPELEDNAWYVHKETGKIIVDGSYGGYNSSYNWYYCNATQYGGDTPSSAAVCVGNLFRYIPFATFRSNTSLNGVSVENGGFRLRNTACSSASNYQTWLSNNNLILYYQLETPTDTKITDATLVGQLNAIDSAVLPKPITYITVGATDPNLPAPLKISYYGRSA